jgi:O-antigen/teichoic acid export membrane protein
MTSVGNAVIAPLRAGTRRQAAVGRRALLRGGTVVLSATLLWHASNFAFNSVAARLLGPSGYAELAATVALLYVASPMLVSVQTMTSRAATALAVEGLEDGIRGLLRVYASRLALVGALVTATAALSSGLLARLLHVHSSIAVAIVVSGLAISLLTHCQRGALQGTSRFGRYAISTSVEAVTKVLWAGLILTLVSRSPDGAVTAVPLAALCTLGANAFLLRFLPRSSGRPSRPQRLAANSGATVSTFVLLALLLSADVLAAKRYLPPAAAGLYAAVSLCGKTTFFASSAVSLFLFPFFSERRERGEDGRRLLVLAFGAVLACSALIATLYFAAPGIVLDPLFGSGYAPAQAYLGRIALAFGCYALMYLAATYLLAQRSKAGSLALAAVAATQVAALVVEHGSVGAIVRVQLLVLGVGAAVLAATALSGRPPETPR